jgi:hypothetical protein
VVELTEHLTHGLMLVAPLLVFAALFVLEWRRTSAEPLPTSLRLMALGTITSGVVHGGVVQEHAREAAVLGWFFTLLALGQTCWVLVLLLNPTERLVRLGIWANLGLLALWAWTRTIGVPLGVGGGGREELGVADVVATAIEIGCVLAGLTWVHARSGARQAVVVAR